MFRRFEFRGLLSRVDLLDEAVPAAEPVRAVGESVPWREGEPSNTLLQGRVGFAADGERAAVATERRGRASSPSGRATRLLQGAELVVARRQGAPRVDAVDDTLIAAYLIEPGRAAYELDDLAAEYGVEVQPDAGGRGGDRRARPPRRRAAPARAAHARAPRERGSVDLYERDRAAADAGAGGDGGRRRQDRHYRMGEITARLQERVEELEAKAYELAGEEFMLGSTQQVARILFEKLELTPGRKGKTGYSTDTRVLRTIRGEHEIVAVIEEWRELLEADQHLPRPAAVD